MVACYNQPKYGDLLRETPLKYDDLLKETQPEYDDLLRRSRLKYGDLLKETHFKYDYLLMELRFKYVIFFDLEEERTRNTLWIRGGLLSSHGKHPAISRSRCLGAVPFEMAGVATCIAGPAGACVVSRGSCIGSDGVLLFLWCLRGARLVVVVVVPKLSFWLILGGSAFGASVPCRTA
ncbi:hypothetical protein LXL04_020394 [Taraxacum kok-saghyz]